MDERARLRLSVSKVGIEFSCLHGGGYVPVDEWGKIQFEGGDPGPLFRLLDEGQVTEIDDARVEASHDVIAGLSVGEARILGLPPRLPHMLRIRITDILSAPDAKFHYQLIDPSGAPVVRPERKGAVISIEGSEYWLQDPLFSVLEGLDEFNGTPPDQREALASWGRLEELLPADAEVDSDYLKELHIGFASAFTLRPFLNDDGEADFDVVPGRMRAWKGVPDKDASPEFEEALPEARMEKFADIFRSLKTARPEYAAGAGWYLVASESLHKVLRVVKGKQLGSPEERRGFVERPQAVLKEELDPEEVPEEVLEDLFYDVGYSDRVVGVGTWAKKVLPWIKKPSHPWLPPERMGVRVGETYVQVDLEDLDQLTGQIEGAIERGDPHVTYKGKEIPATDAAVEALEALLGLRKPDRGKKTDKGGGTPGEGAKKERLVLQILENFEEVEYEAPSRPRGRDYEDLSASMLASRPYPHQRDAIEWLQDHWACGSPGALLADDMGLGKTLEALAFMAWVRELMERGEYRKRPFAVIGPTGLLENWKEEHEKHLEGRGLGTLVEAYGRALREFRRDGHAELEGGLPVLKLECLRQADWVVTTYETWRDYQHSFGKIEWCVAVFDEVQKVKNPAAGVTDAAKAVNADFTLALTGTPVENRLADLWCIVDLVQPGRLGTLKEFSARYEAGDIQARKEALKELKETLLVREPAIMKRRLKENHLDGLPEKDDRWAERPMPRVQAEVYAKEVREARTREDQGNMLRTLGALRSISLHPGFERDGTDDEFIAQSARLSVAFEVLDDVERKDEKALLFIESRDMQGRLCGILQRRYGMSDRPLIINGAVAGRLRQKRVNTFQKRRGFDVMILSPKAGGVGLTLTAANHVIHLSRWWNPAVEDQCTDRVFRIGQDKKVNVYYPLAVHPGFGERSFDLTLDDLLQSKRALSRAVLAPSALSKDEISRLYHETLQRHGRGPENPMGGEVGLSAIDQMEPMQFEDWVLYELRRGGYGVEKTPQTHDAGADGIAHPPDGGAARLIQCKHTQTGKPCGPEAIHEIISSRTRYDVDTGARAVVVTNAPGFTEGARALAAHEGVVLIDRSQLLNLATLTL